MTKHRKSVREKAQEFQDNKSHYWDKFEPRLRAARDIAEALQIAYDAPPESHPGRKFHTNLLFFLNERAPPAGASRTELRLYLELLQRLDSAGPVNPNLEIAIKEAIKTSN